MADHPIEGLMHTALESIKQMVDVNTVVGDAVQTGDGGVIIPVSRVSFGFAAGGGEYGQRQPAGDGPFGGGSGAGVSVQPVGFLVVRGGDIRLLPVDANPTVDRLVDLAPELIDQIASVWGRPSMAGRSRVGHAAPYLDEDDDAPRR